MSVEVSEDEGPSLRLGLVGPPGVGKTTLARFLDSLPEQEMQVKLEGYHGDTPTVPPDIHTIPMRQLLRWYGYQGSSRLGDLQRFHSEARSRGQAEAILRPLDELGAGIYVVDGLRNINDVHYFQKVLGGYVLALHAPLEICRARFLGDGNDEKHADVLGEHGLTIVEDDDAAKAFVARAHERLWGQAMSELLGEGEAPVTSNIVQCMRAANLAIDASGTKQEVVTQVLAAINFLWVGLTEFHPGVHRPSQMV